MRLINENAVADFLIFLVVQVVLPAVASRSMCHPCSSEFGWFLITFDRSGKK